MSVLCKPTWKTKRLHTELDTDFLLTSRFSDVITHTFLLQMNHVAAFNVCQKFHTLTFHWARTRIAQKCASGGDRITTVHGNHFSHRPTCDDWSMKNSSHRVHVLWMKDESSCSSCQIIWLRVQLMEKLNQQNSELQIILN